MIRKTPVFGTSVSVGTSVSAASVSNCSSEAAHESHDAAAATESGADSVAELGDLQQAMGMFTTDDEDDAFSR
jgi:hypothetical protein